MKFANVLTPTLFASLFTGLIAQAVPSQATIDLIKSTYNPTVTAASTDATGRFDVCNLTAVDLTAQDPSTMKPGHVQIKMYIARNATNIADMKTIILMPPTGGENVIDRGYASTLCLKGFRVAILEHWDNDTEESVDNLDIHDINALRSQAAVRHVVEYLQPRRPQQLGILGTSVGAITSALVLGIEPRIASGLLIVGGGGMAKIIATSDEQHLAQVRTARMAKFGYKTTADYEAALRLHMKIDPLDFVGQAGAKSLWMMIATQDTTVPTQTQIDLLNAWTKSNPASLKPEHFETAENHVRTIVITSVTQRQAIIDFFNSHLN